MTLKDAVGVGLGAIIGAGILMAHNYLWIEIPARYLSEPKNS
ncbi:hypothetical protein [Gillisia limnaea]|nr:hypothetical protein [Gillisia limnaea]